MEKKLSFNIILSLKESCLRKVTVILISKPHILDFFDKSDVEDKVKEDMSKLKLPPILIEHMKKLVRPICLQLRIWRTFIKKYLSIPDGSFDLIRIMRTPCWTILGTLDYQKTAIKLIRHEVFNCVKVYILACLFCLDDYIPVLWEKLPDFSKRAFYEEKGFLKNRFTRPPLQFCWPYILKGEVTQLESMARIKIGSPGTFYQYAFEYSAHKGNKAATEYFFLKLTDVEKEISLFKTARYVVSQRLKHFQFFKEETFPEEKFSETVFYLLSLLGHEQQLEILKTYPCHVFTCLLDWPWRENLFDFEGFLVWTFLLEIDNDQQLTAIAEELTSVNYISKLFQELFLHSPSSLRKRFVDRECQSGAFSVFFSTEDLEAIKVIFRNVDSADRKRLVCCEHVFKIFYDLISRGELSFVELCIQEATLSKEDKEVLKDKYIEYSKNLELSNMDPREKIWEQFLNILQ